MTDPGAVIELAGLSYRYGEGAPLVLDDLRFRIGSGWRCLLIGANGAGKTTLLEILAGRHMVPKAQARILGRPAFHDTSLARDVTFIGGTFPFRGDVPVSVILERSPGQDAGRTAELLEVLGVDTAWHMHQVSDGQRRRVQILLHLLQPKRLLLLDEVTTDLDVVARADLLDFLGREADERGATLVYATHIFDGLDAWATHLCFLDRGRLRRLSTLDAIDELAALRTRGVPSPLHAYVEAQLRALK